MAIDPEPNLSGLDLAERDDGGWGGIRTHGGLSPTAVFKTAALNHSATHPARGAVARLKGVFNVGAQSAPLLKAIGSAI